MMVGPGMSWQWITMARDDNYCARWYASKTLGTWSFLTLGDHPFGHQPHQQLSISKSRRSRCAVQRFNGSWVTVMSWSCGPMEDVGKGQRIHHRCATTARGMNKSNKLYKFTTIREAVRNPCLIYDYFCKMIHLGKTTTPGIKQLLANGRLGGRPRELRSDCNCDSVIDSRT